MEVLEFLELYLSATLNLDKAGVAELFESDGKLKADAITQLKAKDVARVKDLTKGKFDEGVKATTKTLMTDFEKKLKEKLKVDSDKTGIELVEEIITAKTPAGTEVTDDMVKKHKVYLDLQESIQAQVKEAVKQKETEFNSFKSQIERKETLATVKAEAEKFFAELKVVLPADAAKAERQKSLFFREIEAGNYRIDNGRIILLNEKGEDDTDEHGKRKDFAEVIKGKISETFETAASDSKSSAGAQGGGAGAGSPSVKVPKTKDEYIAAMGTAKDATERAAITEAWTKSQDAAK